MSMRITGPSPLNPAAGRRPEAVRERPAAPATAGAAPAPAPLPEAGRAEPDTAELGAALGLPAEPPAGEQAPQAAEQALESAEQVRRSVAEQPAQAARVHGLLVPATVLNLLA
jgi:hypothetical protein